MLIDRILPSLAECWLKLSLLADNGPKGGSSWLYFLGPATVVLLFWVMVLGPTRREQQKRLAQLRNLKKNDHVVTTGGIFGVVTDLQPESGTVTIRVDEGTNTKLRVRVAAIEQVITDRPSGDKVK